MEFVCLNGNFLPAGEALFTAQNRSFRYGDGLFETIKIYKGQILLESFHYDRLFLSLKMLQMEVNWNAADITGWILELCKRNQCSALARVRLAVFRDHDNKAGFVMEAFALNEEVNQWNAKGLVIDLYPYSRKNMDAFSNLKTANFLPYVLAELFARDKRVDDAIVLNASGYVADSSKANVFLVRDKEIVTPALHQGCISGVMRRFLMDALKKNGYRIRQGEISEQDLLDADEIFLTNSIYDLRWVVKFREKTYSSGQSLAIYQKIITPLYV